MILYKVSEVVQLFSCRVFLSPTTVTSTSWCFKHNLRATDVLSEMNLISHSLPRMKQTVPCAALLFSPSSKLVRIG